MQHQIVKYTNLATINSATSNGAIFKYSNINRAL